MRCSGRLSFWRTSHCLAVLIPTIPATVISQCSAFDFEAYHYVFPIENDEVNFAFLDPEKATFKSFGIEHDVWVRQAAQPLVHDPFGVFAVRRTRKDLWIHTRHKIQAETLTEAFFDWERKKAISKGWNAERVRHRPYHS